MNDLAKRNVLRRLGTGFISPFRSARFLRIHPRLLQYVLIPFAINTIVFSLVVFGGWQLLDGVVLHHLPQGDAWYWVLLSAVVRLLAMLTTTVLVFFTFTAIGCLIASPFNDLLAARVWQLLTNSEEVEPLHLDSFWRDTITTLVDESKKIFLFVLGMLVLLLLNLVPGIGSLLYAGLSVLWTIFFLVIEFTGYVFNHLHLRFGEQRGCIMANKAAFFGFGLGVFGMLAIPLLQFFCIPLAVIGGTRLYHAVAPMTKPKKSIAA